MTSAQPALDLTGGPHDPDAEKIVIGAMMLTPDTADEVIDIIVSSVDFASPANGLIYATIVGLLADEEPNVSPTAVAAALAATGDLGRLPGGGAYLHDCLAAVPTYRNATYYAKRVAEMATRRRVLAAGMRVVQMANTTGIDTPDLLDRAQQAIHSATLGRDTSNAIRLGDIIDAVIEDIFSGKRPEGAVSTGLHDLDLLTGGLHAGRLVLVAGRPGMGKSIAAIDFARAAARTARKAGIPSLIFSLEMGRQEITERIIAAECAVNLSRVTNRQLTPDERRAVEAKREELRATPILIEDTPNMTIASVRSSARRAVQRDRVGLIVVDYLQLLQGARKTESRQQEVSEISRGLKLLARELQVPVVACSQLNRASESRGDKRPSMADLRESGSLEQDADVVILLHRDDYHDKESPRAGEVDFIVAKNRFGPQETVTAAAQLDRARFVDFTPVEEPRRGWTP